MTKDFKVQQQCSRLLTAAVINGQFRKALLSNPGKAIASGFSGEAFNLSGEVKQRLSSIRADSLADFASQMAQL